MVVVDRTKIHGERIFIFSLQELLENTPSAVVVCQVRHSRNIRGGGSVLPFMSENKSTQIQLVRRPAGMPVAEDFRTVTVELPDLGENQVRVRNEFISVDPYMRGRMNDSKSYIPPFELGETMQGSAVGRVIESTSPEFREGDLVTHFLGWRDIAQADAQAFTQAQELGDVASSVYLGALGLTGMTAYMGLMKVAELKEGDNVFISGAAGAVGSMAGQIAKLKGAREIIGSAGGSEKTALLTQRFGFTQGIDYKAAPILTQLEEAAPNGIDVYFDNVGGDHLEAALNSFNRYGRAALCGAISVYNEKDPNSIPGPRFMTNIVTRSLSMKGFVLQDYLQFAQEFREEIAPHVISGEITYDETVVEGLHNALDAFFGLFSGKNTGKMVVKI